MVEKLRPIKTRPISQKSKMVWYHPHRKVKNAKMQASLYLYPHATQQCCIVLGSEEIGSR